MDTPQTSQAFSSLALKPALLENLASLGYNVMTDVQRLALPPVLEGKDVIAQAKTGSGKTAAFGLGLLHKLDVKKFRIQTLILCPTRELADQVAVEIRRLGRGIHNIKVLTLCGGTPFGPQIGSLEHGAHIIVGTPGRVEEHVRKGTLKLEHVDTFILDEADRMLDMGFEPALEAISEKLTNEKQTLLFSATFADNIKAIAEKTCHDPVFVKVEDEGSQADITQYGFLVTDAERFDAVRRLLMSYRPTSTLIFCNTKKDTQGLANDLARAGLNAVAIHGDMEQRDRDDTLIRFSNNSVSILVATDVAARGLDIDQLDAVINYQLAREQEVHVHRVGRTGRAGQSGLALTLYGDRETIKFSSLQKYLNKEIETIALPDASVLNQPTFKASMITIQISAGKKQKVRPGDILGALTGEDGIAGDDVGSIKVRANHSFVAVKRKVATEAISKLSHGKIKGRSFKIRELS